MNTPKQMKPSCKGFILQDSNYTALGNGRYRHGKGVQRVSDAGSQERQKMQNTKDFECSVPSLYL